MSIFKSLRRTVSKIGRSPLASTALSLFPPTSIIGLSLKAYQGLRTSTQPAIEEYLRPQPPPGTIQPNNFWSEAWAGARVGRLAGPIGGLAGAAVGGIGSLILGGPDDEEDDYEEDDYEDDDY